MMRIIVVLGIGNELITEDSFGPALAKALAAEGKIKALNCSTAPENFLKYVKEGDPVIFADSARMPGEEGNVLLLERPVVSGIAGSTHTMSLEKLARFAKGKAYFLVYSPPEGCTPKDIRSAVSRAKEIAYSFLK